MISYPFIEQLFKNILTASKGIEGRFVICPQMGVEINTDNFNQVIEAEYEQRKWERKYPVALMMPPSSAGSYTGRNGEWEEFQFIMFFLKTSYFSSTNQTVNPNPNTKTSRHTIPQDWTDMARCAKSFLNVLASIQKTANLINTAFRLDHTGNRIIRPVSLVGADTLSGVRLDFRASLYLDCINEDYEDEDISEIEIPDLDLHPVHNM